MIIDFETAVLIQPFDCNHAMLHKFTYLFGDLRSAFIYSNELTYSFRN